MSETIADIAREMREQCRHNKENVDLDWLPEEVGDLQLRLADRIEAAHKREREAVGNAAAKSASEVYEPHIQSLQVGNAAKMREALRNADIVLSQTSNGYHSPVRQEIKAALSAPPRNCDKCLTPKDAMLAHLEEVYEGEKVELGDYEWCEFVKWIFAEAKGEAK